MFCSLRVLVAIKDVAFLAWGVEGEGGGRNVCQDEPRFLEEDSWGSGTVLKAHCGWIGFIAN